ncbi:MAG TPA: TonB-dependent receptor [Gemmatimonadales bacterium]|nr:TonB-dependent receptor [Gemmatimonadales bacterium]
MNRWSIRGGMLAALAMLPLPSLYAQQDSAAIELPDIVVSESRLPIPANAVTAAVTVLSGDELRQRGLSLLQDALREVPSATVVEPGSFGAVTSLFVRGGESDYVKVLVDGVPVNEPGGAFNFAGLTLDDVERIEIVRGPASVTYGSDAVTGVVRIVTRQGRGRPHGSAAVEGGTFASVRGRADASGTAGKLSWSLGGSSSTTDGTYAFNNQFRNSAGTGRLVWRPDGRSDLSATARYGWNTFHFPTDGAGIASDSNQFSRARSLALGLDGGRQLSARVELRGAAAYARSRSFFDDTSDGAWDTTGFAFASSSETGSSRWNLDGRAVVRPTLTSMVSAGAQFERQLVTANASYSSNFGDGASTESDPPFDRSRNDVAVYLEARTEPVHGLILTGGGRLDDDEVFGSYGTWRAGARLALPRGFALRAAAGTGFKAPTFAENFASSPFEVGNRNLDPERSRSWEVGLEHDLAAGRLRSGVSWYDQRFRNLIQYVAAPPGEPTYQNLGAALARGIEATASARLLPDVSVGGSWSWLETRVTDAGESGSPGFSLGDRLLRRPANTLRFWGSASPVARLQFGAEVVYTGDRDDVDFSSFPSERITLPAYTLLNASLNLAVLGGVDQTPEVTLTARGDNLLDTDYNVIAGFPGRGRTLMVGARVGW